MSPTTNRLRGGFFVSGLCKYAGAFLFEVSMSSSIEEKAKEMAGRWDFDPKIGHFFSDNLYAKEAHFPANSEILSHKHNYSHLSILAQGEVILITDDAPPVHYKAPACIEIRAGVNHAIQAVTDSVWYCIHATDEKDVGSIDEVLIQGSGG